MASQVEGDGDRTISTNRRARHEYEILETVEAGLVLRGTEVKSLRDGGVNFKDSYATIRNGEGWLIGCHINPYSHGTDANHEPDLGAAVPEVEPEGDERPPALGDLAGEPGDLLSVPQQLAVTVSRAAGVAGV